MEKIPFGVATITLDPGGASPLALDGSNYLQADGGELNIEPILGEITFQDFGETVYDDYINGYTGELTVVLGQNELELMRKFFAYHADIVDAVDGTTVVGATDEAIGKSLRSKAVPVKIHPREMGADTSLDITIYKMAGTGAFNRVYESAQGKYEVTLKMYPRDNADATTSGNFYYIGNTDPNA